MFGLCLFFCSVLSLSSVASAEAAPGDPGADLGAGKDPSISMAHESVAHVAFNGVEPGNQTVRYCEVQVNNSSLPRCEFPQTLTPPGDTVSPPYVLEDAANPFNSVVRVLTARYGLSGGSFSQTLLYSAANRRTPLGEPISVGAVSPFGGEAISGPESSISITNGSSAQHSYQAVPTDGSSAGEQSAALSQNYPYGGSVGLAGPLTPLVTSNDGAASPTTAFSRYMGGGSINDAVNWSAPAVVGQGDQGQLAGGPTGLYLLLHSTTGGEHLELRRFGGTSFGVAKPVPGATGSIGESFLAQDPDGALHALWVDGTQLKYTVSADEGNNWSPPYVVATEPRFSGLRAAVGPGGQGGFAVWTADSAESPHVHAAYLGTTAAPKPIQAVYSYAPKPFCTGQKITFAGSASQAASQFKITSYRWSFTTEPARDDGYPGGGQREAISKSGPSVTSAFDYTRTGYQPHRHDKNPVTQRDEFTPGHFYLIRDPIRVTLVVTDANGHTAKLSRVITFANDLTQISDSGEVTPGHPRCRGPAPRAHFRVVSRATFRPASRKVTVPITCNKGPASCMGTIAISLPGTAARNAGVAARSRRLVLTGFLVQPGKTRRIEAKLSKSAKRLLLRRHPRRLVVSVKNYGPNGKRIDTVRQSVRLVTKR